MLTVLKYILIPLSLLYCFIARVRNYLYDKSFIKVRKVNAFVISVGNVTVGGTGKTPFVISLAEHFIKKGHKVGIVSRGYGRSSLDMTLVCDGANIRCGIKESGDELMMISRKLLKKYKYKFYTVAGYDRVSATEYLIKNFSADIILLDDAFQHRKIHRDFDIVLIDGSIYYSDSFSRSFCIPSGLLREKFKGIFRADLIIYNKKFSNVENNLSLPRQATEVLEAEYEIEGLFDFDGNKVNIIPAESVSFSGIADDESFKVALKLLGTDSKMHFSFNDHYDYSVEDLKNIMNKNQDGLPLITTEKDAVRMSLFSDFLSSYTVYYVTIYMKTDWNVFDKILSDKSKKGI